MIVDTVKLCGMQVLPLRDHRDDKTSDPLINKGVFDAIIKHAAKTDEILREHIEHGKRNQQYTSKTIQNEIINVIASCFRENILEPLKLVKYFSIIADEVTDRHGKTRNTFTLLEIC